MGVDVAHVFRLETGRFQRARHLQRLAPGVGCGVVRRVERPAGAGELGQNRRAARLGTLFSLQYQHAGALRQHETAALRIEGARCARRIVVALLGESAEHRHRRDADGRNDRLRSAGEQHLRRAGADHVEGVA